MQRTCLRILILLLTTAIYFTPAFARENIFYMLHYKDKHELKNILHLLAKNNKKISIIISQAYQIDGGGLLTGYLNEEIVDLAKNKSFKLMAMVTNKAYDQKQLHQFLLSSLAQDQALANLVMKCKKNKLYGVQFDFEMVSVHDKDLLTAFYKKAALTLKHAGFKVSFAVIPAFPVADNSLFSKRTFENWSGAYDLKVLGRYADFVTIMAYNQHVEVTLPGPNASISWVKAAIKNTLHYIPANKISLGIPAYSLYWFTGEAERDNKIVVAPKCEELGYADAMRIIKDNHAHVNWNNTDKINSSIYPRNWLNEYIYLEDSASFKAKLRLVNKYKLRGISVFRLGTEDPRIWSTQS